MQHSEAQRIAASAESAQTQRAQASLVATRAESMQARARNHGPPPAGAAAASAARSNDAMVPPAQQPKPPAFPPPQTLSVAASMRLLHQGMESLYQLAATSRGPHGGSEHTKAL